MPAMDKQAKRILLIANTGWYLRNFRSELVRRLEAAGYSVSLAAPRDEETRTAFFQDREFFGLSFSRKGTNPVKELAAVWNLFGAIRKARPDVVLTWTPKPDLYGGIVGRLLRVPVLPNVSGLGAVFVRGGLLARVVGRLYGFAFARSPVVFFQNDDDRSAFVQAGRVVPEKAELLPGSGVDLARFAVQPLPAREPFGFLYVGRLIADKGLRELVECARRLRARGYAFELRLAGFVDAGNPAGISQAELDDWVNSGLVNYLGALDDVRPSLHAAHCVVLPSYYREGVPRSLLEAAATARPIITTDAIGCRDAAAAGESGFLCEPRSVDSLLECMQRMLDLPARELTAMGHAGRRHVEDHFSEEIVLQAYLRHCDALVGE